MTKLLEVIAEQATGIRQNPHGIGKFYLSGGVEVSAKKAQEAIMNEQTVEVPNAGAGSYTTFFTAVGFSQVKVIEQSSSAGDWTFGVKDGDFWYAAFQSNRYPYHGFQYSINRMYSSETFTELANLVFA